MGMYSIGNNKKLKQLLECIDAKYKVYGKCTTEIKGVASIFDGQKGFLSYCLYNTEDKLSVIQQCHSSVLLLHSDMEKYLLNGMDSEKVYIFSNNPKLMYVQMFSEVYSGIGSNTVIDEGAVVSEKCMIGSNVHIQATAEIHDGVTIESGSIIGARGLSFAQDEDGSMLQMPQFGRVILNKNVWIGANTVVVRGLLDDTVIGEGSLIGNLCNVGHEVKIGRNTFISGGVIIAGGVEIGDNCWIGPGVKILQKVKIGNGSKVAIGSLVVKDVAAEMFVGGNPARVISRASAKESMVR